MHGRIDEKYTALACDETGAVITGEIYLATRSDVNCMSGLSPGALAPIPMPQRRRERCGRGEGGIDIYLGRGKPAPRGYHADTCKLTEFKYSISQVTAEAYLPKHVRRYEDENFIKGVVP